MSAIDIVKQYDARVNVRIDTWELGVFDNHSPANISSDTGRHRPGGRRNARATRGLPNRDTGTVAKAISGSEIDVFRRLERRAGRAEMIVTEQPLDPNGDPFGKPTVFRGVFQGIEWGDYDSDSSDDRTVTLTYQPDDEIG